MFLNVKRHMNTTQVIRQHFLGKTRLFLIQIHSDDIEVDGRTLTQQQQNIEQTIAVFAARYTHHHFVALFNHIEVGNGLTHLLCEALFQLVEFKGLFLFSLVGENRDGLHG